MSEFSETKRCHNLQYVFQKILEDSATFQFCQKMWHFLVFENFDTFQFWHFQILTFPGFKRFWHLPVSETSDTIRFSNIPVWFFKILTPSSYRRFWHIQILTHSDSDTFRFWYFQVLKYSCHILTFWQPPASENSKTLQFWHIQILPLSGLNQKWILTLSRFSIIGLEENTR